MRSTTSVRVLQILALAGGLALAAGTLPAGRSQGKDTPPEIAGYKNWKLVNPTPYKMASAVQQLCAPPTPAQRDKDAKNPHRDKFIRVFVNDTGRAAMLEQKNPNFPVGSVIVKEKLPDKDSTQPELLTVMIKRAAGYNPDGGDWEYLVTDGAGVKMQARGKLENCHACHLDVKANGYVFRRYLTFERLEKLR